MHKKQSFGFLVVLLIITSLLAACSGTSSTTSSTNATAIQTTKTAASTTQPVATTTAKTSSPTTTKVTTANWWNELGEPKYGGTINQRVAALGSTFDVTLLAQVEQAHVLWWEEMWATDPRVDPDEWTVAGGFVPDEYIIGCLAESWEITDPVTLTVKIRKGIRYVNKPPANGREFTADDVQYHYDRMLGTGSGFTTPNAGFAGPYAFLKKAVATEKYTVAFTFAKASAMNFNSIGTALGNKIECREAVEQGGGKISDWKTAVGTGPWVLSNIVTGSVYTYNKNPDYWGYDERYPKNRLPYADTLNMIVIADNATALAGLRTGKVDSISADWQQAKTLAQSDPELKQFASPASGYCLQYRYDLAPFNDIKVRKALQMAVNLPELATNYYGGTVEAIPNGKVSQFLKGYSYPYKEWSQELKDEYSYNPTKAKSLLAEAGYPNGFKASCVASSNANLELLQVLKAYLKEIGVEMEISTMDVAAWGNFVRAGKAESMMYSAFPLCGEFSPSMILGTITPTVRNYNKVKEPELDKLASDYASAASIAQVAQIMTQIDKVTLEKHMQVQTFNIKTYSVYQPWLIGSIPPGTINKYAWVDQDLKKSMGK